MFWKFQLREAEARHQYLKADYPMVAENYSTHRREMAHKIGLGRKAGQKASPAPEPKAAALKSRRSLTPNYYTDADLSGNS